MTNLKLPRRKFLHLAAGAAALPAVSRMAMAQAYPARPVRIVVGYAAGGGNDITARIMGQWLSERLRLPLGFVKWPGAQMMNATRARMSPPPVDITQYVSLQGRSIYATPCARLD